MERLTAVSPATSSFTGEGARAPSLAPRFHLKRAIFAYPPVTNRLRDMRKKPGEVGEIRETNQNNPLVHIGNNMIHYICFEPIRHRAGARQRGEIFSFRRIDTLLRMC